MDAADDATAAEVGAVTFKLPVQPLSATLQLMLAAVSEVQRAGGPVAPPDARHVLAARLQVSATSDVTFAASCSEASIHSD